MSMILFSRSIEELPTAIATVNEFLRYKRQYRHGASGDEILGVVLREELHKAIPTWKSFELEYGTGALSDNCDSEKSPSDESEEGAVAIRAAFACRGLWALCTFDGPGLHGATDADIRRERIAALLKNACGNSGWTFLPVLWGGAYAAASPDRIPA